MPLPVVHIYTDGACSPNPGVGGWGAILISPRHQNSEKEISGAEATSTNNRMEIMAAVRALKSLKVPCEVHVFTDSEYLRNAFAQGWLARWKVNGWKTASKKPVANQDLWIELDEAMHEHKVVWNWVRGHAEDPLNERCDRLAVQAREELAKSLGSPERDIF